MIRADKDVNARMIEHIEIHLKYEGPDVQRGTMALQDVIPVLQGISGAYIRLASTEDPSFTHRITLADVRQGSADIVLEVIEWLVENKEPIAAATGLTTLAGVGYKVVKRIIDVVRIKKHVGTEPSSERIVAQDSIVIMNSGNVELVVDRPAYEAYKNGTIDKDLERLTRPLQQGRIDSAQFTVHAESQETIREAITTEDRPVFEITDLAVTSTQETELVATLNSLTKSTNSGYLYLLNEKRVFYRYIGDNASNLYAIFGSHEGAVKIRCIAELDDQLEVLSLDILQIEPLQRDMFGDTTSTHPPPDST